MHELSAYNWEEGGRILDIVPNALQPDRFRFVIDATATGKDVLSTLAYIEPDAVIRKSYIYSLLSYGVQSGKVNNGQFEVPYPVEHVSDKASTIREIKFGDNLTIDDVTGAVEAVCGQEHVAPNLQALLSMLVDKGDFRDVPVGTPMHNEFAVADTGIATEMHDLTRWYCQEEG